MIENNHNIETHKSSLGVETSNNALPKAHPLGGWGVGKSSFSRFRPLRETQALRDQHADVHINANDFIYLYFVV